MNSVTASELAWHMHNHAVALDHEWVTPNALFYAWESDLLTVTKNGLVCEVEIKCSRADLLNDLKKPKHAQGMLMNGSFMAKDPARNRTPNQSREDLRRNSGMQVCRRPNYFSFAMPCVIYRKLPAGKLPQYAGVYTIDAEGRVFEERAPIQLHTERIGTSDLLGLAKRMHQRYWNELRKEKHGGSRPIALDPAV